MSGANVGQFFPQKPLAPHLQPHYQLTYHTPYSRSPSALLPSPLSAQPSLCHLLQFIKHAKEDQQIWGAFQGAFTVPPSSSTTSQQMEAK